MKKFLCTLSLFSALIFSLSQVAFADGFPQLVSLASDGTLANNASFQPAVSSDGRYIVFVSLASNLVLNGENQRHVYIRDISAGSTEQVDLRQDGGQPAGGSGGRVSISADGRYIAFANEDIVPAGPDTNLASCSGVCPNNNGDNVFVHDRSTGQTERVSISSTGQQPRGFDYNPESFQPTISTDGRYVKFTSNAEDLVPNKTDRSFTLFIHDRVTGITELATDFDQTGINFPGTTTSADGHYSAFLQGNSLGVTDAVVQDNFASGMPITNLTNNQFNNSVGDTGPFSGVIPNISADGHFIVFNDKSSALVPGDTNGTFDVFTTKNPFIFPIVKTASLPDGIVGTTYQQTLAAFGGASPYTWSIVNGALPNGLALSSSGLISGIATTMDVYSFTVQVSDGNSQTDSRTLSIDFNDHTAPISQPTQSPPPNTRGWNNGDVTVTWNWTDSDGTGIDSANCTDNSTSSGEGNPIVLNAACKDLAENTGTASYSVEVDKTPPSVTLTVQDVPNGGGIIGTPYTAGTPTVGPVRVHYDCTDSLSGNFDCPSDQFFFNDGVYFAHATSTDRAGNQTVTQFGPIVIDNPTLASHLLPPAIPGVPYSFSFTASGGTPPYSFTIVNGSLPDGLTFDPVHNVLSGTPTSTTTSPVLISVQVQDSLSVTTIGTANFPVLYFLPTSLPHAIVGVPYSFQLQIVNSQGFLTTGMASGTGSLPPGLDITQAQGLISGTPTQVGTYHFIVYGQDNVGETDQPYTLVVDPAPLAITTNIQPLVVFPGQTYNQALIAVGGTPSYHWFTTGDLPPGIIPNLIPNGTFAGTISVNASGIYNFSLVVVDAAHTSAQKAFAIHVVPPLQIAGGALPGVLQGATYSQTLQVQSGETPFTWYINPSSLPPGLTLDASTGQISGTATTAGSFSFAVGVIDTFGQHASTTSSIDVAPPILTLTTTADSFLRNGQSNRNEGANPHIFVQSSGQNRAVLSFDSSAISNFVAAHGASSAKLILTIAANGNNWGTTGRTIDAQPLTASFTEGNGEDAGLPNSQSTRGTGSGVTWNCAIDSAIQDANTDCNPKWNGGSFGSATASTQTIVNNQTGEMQWDVTQDILGGSSSWLVKKTNEGVNGTVEYYSREGAASAGNATYAARLVLTP